MKNRKAAGPSEKLVEEFKILEEEGILWLTDLLNNIMN